LATRKDERLTKAHGITSKTMYDLMKIIVDQQAKIIELTESKNRENHQI
jgi:hypothetical protein